MIKTMLDHCVKGEIDKAYEIMNHMWRMGYAPEDIIGNVFKNCKTHSMPEFLKLEYVKVTQKQKLKRNIDNMKSSFKKLWNVK